MVALFSVAVGVVLVVRPPRFGVVWPSGSAGLRVSASSSSSSETRRAVGGRDTELEGPWSFSPSAMMHAEGARVEPRWAIGGVGVAIGLSRKSKDLLEMRVLCQRRSVMRGKSDDGLLPVMLRSSLCTSSCAKQFLHLCFTECGVLQRPIRLVGSALLQPPNQPTEAWNLRSGALPGHRPPRSFTNHSTPSGGHHDKLIQPWRLA